MADEVMKKIPLLTAPVPTEPKKVRASTIQSGAGTPAAGVVVGVVVGVAIGGERS
jgi:hypothetical protein